MSRSLIFDAGPVISFGLTDLTWLLKGLKERFGGEFYITPYVREELVDIPLKSRKFKLEAFQVDECIREGIIREVRDDALVSMTRHLMDIANNLYHAQGQALTIVQFGEMSTLALACHLRAEAVVIDERATRALLEDPRGFTKRLSHRFNAKVTMSEDSLRDWQRALCDLRVIRSVELATVAFELGLLDRYLVRPMPGVKNPRRELLDAVLWGIKLNGCAVSEEEIRRILKLENLD